MLGTEFSDYDRRTGDKKHGLKTGAGSSHGTSVQAPIRFVILHPVYDSLGRLATASERLASGTNTKRKKGHIYTCWNYVHPRMTIGQL